MNTDAITKSSEKEQGEGKSLSEKVLSVAIPLTWLLKLWNSCTAFLGYDSGVEPLLALIDYLLL